MPICIAGMHRSGTSMIASLLQNAGVYLGEESDFFAAKEDENADGFWEHFGFYALNERLLLHLHAGWDAPWIPEGWDTRQDLEPFREEAHLLVERMGRFTAVKGFWGWKDPRNSITIPFWRSILPDVQVLICVRNPVEVVASLSKRNNLSLAASARLWLRYYESLLTHVPRSKRVITHYENYFEHFEQEFGCVCNALGLPVDQARIDQARARTKPELRHNRATHQELCSGDFTSELIQMYDCLLKEAGETFIPKVKEADPALNGALVDFAKSRFNAETARREETIRRLILENSSLKEKLAGFEEKLNEFAERMDVAEMEHFTQLESWTAMVKKAFETHRLVVSKQTQLHTLQQEVKQSQRDEKSAMLHWVRHSKLVNFLYRRPKKFLKAGKRLCLQRDLSHAMADNLGALMKVADVIRRRYALKVGGVVPPGLEGCSTEKSPVDISKLATRLRLRAAK
jgi:hypothetical protein